MFLGRGVHTNHAKVSRERKDHVIIEPEYPNLSDMGDTARFHAAVKIIRKWIRSLSHRRDVNISGRDLSSGKIFERQ